MDLSFLYAAGGGGQKSSLVDAMAAWALDWVYYIGKQARKCGLDTYHTLPRQCRGTYLLRDCLYFGRGEGVSCTLRKDSLP